MSVLWTIAISATVAAVVSFTTNGLLKAASDRVVEAWQQRKKRRHVLEHGDHTALASAGHLGVSAGASGLTRLSVTIAPAVALRTAGHRLDPDAVAAWVEVLSPLYATYRAHSDPDELIRYVLDDSVVEVRHSGAIRVVMPLMDDTGWEDPPASTCLDFSSVVGTLAHTVTALLDDRGYPGLFANRMQTDNVDWHVDISSSVFIDGVNVPRVGLTFAGREPDQGTVGQVAISAGVVGFGGDDLRNVPVSKDAHEVIMIVLKAFIEKSGYSGLTECLADVQSEVDASLNRCRANLAD